jgi:hypothetical protein
MEVLCFLWAFGEYAGFGAIVHAKERYQQTFRRGFNTLYNFAPRDISEEDTSSS